MKRRWNFSLWAGFILVLAGLLSYIPVFSLYPITRDFPWVNLLLFLVGGILLGAGLMRAFSQPQFYRGKIFGPILTALSVIGVGLFVYGFFFHARQVPSAAAAPRLGQKAPRFTLPDQNGKPVSLAELLSPPAGGTTAARWNAALLIFYRGYW